MSVVRTLAASLVIVLALLPSASLACVEHCEHAAATTGSSAGHAMATMDHMARSSASTARFAIGQVPDGCGESHLLSAAILDAAPLAEPALRAAALAHVGAGHTADLSRNPLGLPGSSPPPFSRSAPGSSSTGGACLTPLRI